MKKFAKRLKPGDTVIAKNGKTCEVLEANRVRHPENRRKQLVSVIYQTDELALVNRRVAFFELKTLVEVADEGVS